MHYTLQLRRIYSLSQYILQYNTLAQVEACVAGSAPQRITELALFKLLTRIC